MHLPSTRRASLLTSLASLPLVFGIGLAACSSDGVKAQPCPAKIDAEVQAADFKFTPRKLTAKAGTYTVRLSESGAINHTFEIRGVDGKAVVSPSTKTACATFTLTAGEYTYFCSVSGHEAAGMKGTLTVS